MNKKIYAVLLLILLVFAGCQKADPKKDEKPSPSPTPAAEKFVTGTAVLEPAEKYVVSAAVTGDVVSDKFSEGQKITAGAVLYDIDKTSIQTEIQGAKLEIEGAELASRQTKDSIAKQTIKSTATGTITEINIIKGGTIQVGQTVCKIVNDRTMLLKIPFLESDISSIKKGQTAKVSLIGTFFEVDGTVSKISAGNMISSGGSEVKMVEISLTNPGAVTIYDKATAKISDISCADVGGFEYSTSEMVSTEGSGKIIDLPVKVGDYVSTGAVLAKLSTENLDNALDQNAVKIKAAKIRLEALENRLKDFTVTSPVSGTVLSKSVKAGETISQVNMNNLAVIANLDNIIFKLAVDEMDITAIKLSQKVAFTAEAIPGKEFEGTVSYISEAGNVVGDVTLYEVRVAIKKSDELKSGMNVAAKIKIAAAKATPSPKPNI